MAPLVMMSAGMRDGLSGGCESAVCVEPVMMQVYSGAAFRPLGRIAVHWRGLHGEPSDAAKPNFWGSRPGVISGHCRISPGLRRRAN